MQHITGKAPIYTNTVVEAKWRDERRTIVSLLHILPSIDKSHILWQQNDRWLDTLLWRGRVTQVSKCHNTKMSRLHREFLASSPSTSRVSSVLVDNFFLQSGIKSSFLEFANNISLAVCLKLVALKVSPKMSLWWNSKSKIHQGANRTCPPCWWCSGSPPAIAHRASSGREPRRSLLHSSIVEPRQILVARIGWAFRSRNCTNHIQFSAISVLEH